MGQTEFRFLVTPLSLSRLFVANGWDGRQWESVRDKWEAVIAFVGPLSRDCPRRAINLR